MHQSATRRQNAPWCSQNYKTIYILSLRAYRRMLVLDNVYFLIWKLICYKERRRIATIKFSLNVWAQGLLVPDKQVYKDLSTKVHVKIERYWSYIVWTIFVNVRYTNLTTWHVLNRCLYQSTNKLCCGRYILPHNLIQLVFFAIFSCIHVITLINHTTIIANQ